MDALWAATQDPDQHQRWDVRFGSIQYLPRRDGDQRQQFTYATTIVPGFTVAGTGSLWATETIRTVRSGPG
jgi:hypothetical protein